MDRSQQIASWAVDDRELWGRRLVEETPFDERTSRKREPEIAFFPDRFFSPVTWYCYFHRRFVLNPPLPENVG